MAGRTGLVVVDMLNTYEHEDAEPLTRGVERIVEPLSRLIARARNDAVELIYVNDNYGDWNSSQEELARRACEGARPDLVEPVLPPEDADFVIKARHTIFYMTPLEYLLGQKEIDRIVLTGGCAKHDEAQHASGADPRCRRAMGERMSEVVIKVREILRWHPLADRFPGGRAGGRGERCDWWQAGQLTL